MDYGPPGERPSPCGSLAVELLKAVAGGEENRAASLPGEFERAWLTRRRIDSLLPDNPPQDLYQRIWDGQQAALAEALGALGEAGVEVLVFKGAEFLPRYHGGRALGVMADVDVLVRDGEAEGAREAVLGVGFRHAFMDYRAMRPQAVEPAELPDLERDHYELAPLLRAQRFEPPAGAHDLVGGGPAPFPVWREGEDWWLAVVIDVHRAPAANIPGDGFFGAAVPSALGRGRSMSPTDLLWFTVSRYYTEVATTGKRSLRDFAHLAALLREEEVEWDRVEAASRRYELGASIYYYLRFLRSVLGLPVPEQVLDAARPSRTARRRDWGWQLGALFELIEPMPRLS